MGCMSTPENVKLDTFENRNPEKNYTVLFECPEFTCLCPMTAQPDFATINIRYIPDRLCVELKSLKLYLWSYRDTGTFHEDVTNKILDDLVKALSPRFLEVSSKFWVRGGITTTVVAQHPNPDAK
jgi:7-cyano-7-deazaguanine reductase